MSNNRRNRERRPGRRTPFLEPKHRILVVCEGANTDPQYLMGFKRACHNPRVSVLVHPEHGVPKTLVELGKKAKKEADKAAKAEEDDNLRFDSVWAVFDIDEHPHIGDAVQMARDNGIDLAISNPSFELWLLLHFRDSPGMKGRKEMTRILKKYVADYDKHVDYDLYKAGYTAAVTRAVKLETLVLGDNKHETNPTTGVHRLTESIRIN
jgi:RloB-like protein